MRHRKLLSLLILALLTISHSRANGPNGPNGPKGPNGPNGPKGHIGYYTRTEDGIIVYPDNLLSGRSAVVRLSVISDRIIRVVSDPVADQVADPVRQAESLIAMYVRDSSLRWEVLQNDSEVVLTTRLLRVAVALGTGAVRFMDPSGKPVLAEKKTGGRSFEAAVFEGKPCYHIRQTFTTADKEAFYGLGQHQDGLVNYKGHQVNLFQNNTEVAVPFLLSSGNYGILWDNYSLTAVGDVRPYKQLSAIGLYSAHKEEGWLTACYHNDKLMPGVVNLEKAESVIDYSYLGDSKKLLPAEFDPAKGSVTWEGSLASGMTGVHVFHFTYGGYLKVFIDGKLELDRWRQAWNPGSAILDLPMEKNKKVPVRIEWAPDGGESYLSLKWLDPLPAGQQDDVSFSSEAGSQLDYYFIYGKNPDEVIAGYRQLTGKSTIVPKWAMGLWQSRERYKTQEEILNTVKEFRTRQIPLDNIVLDWSYWKQDEWGSQEFDASRFPSPDSMIRMLHKDYHSHFMISVWPKFYKGIAAYKEFDEKGWLYKRNVADSQRDWIGKGYISTFYDAFNPGARKGFWDLLNKKLYNKGIDAWWMDASEPDILSNVSPEKRKEQMTSTALGPAAGYLNAYPLMNAKGIYEGQRAANPDKRVFILTRSAFAGSQHYGAAVWSGDIAARWSDMKDQIAAGINFSLSGIPYWTSDIGGFAVERRFEEAKGENLEEWREQMTRWYQFGAFCPLFRVHGQFPFREIYNVAPEDHPAYKSMLYYDKLRYRLLPYLYSLSGMVWKDDYTIMRGLVMDFGSDTAVHNIADEYMLGPSLLAAPVTAWHDRTRKTYLPAGQGWYDLYSGKYTPGGQTITADAPYERMPLYVKEGTILPMGPDLQYTDQRPADTITLYVYTGRNADFTLYEDEGTNYNYEKGAYTCIPMHFEEATGTLSIRRRQGSFAGMLQRRVFMVKWIGSANPLSTDGIDKASAICTYNGGEKTLRIRQF